MKTLKKLACSLTTASVLLTLLPCAAAAPIPTGPLTISDPTLPGSGYEQIVLENFDGWTDGEDYKNTSHDPAPKFTVSHPEGVGGTGASDTAFTTKVETGNPVLEYNILTTPTTESRSQIQRPDSTGVTTGVAVVSLKYKFTANSNFFLDLGKPDNSGWYIETKVTNASDNLIVTTSNGVGTTTTFNLHAPHQNIWGRLDVVINAGSHTYDVYISGRKLNDMPLKGVHPDATDRAIGGIIIRTNNASGNNSVGAMYFDDLYLGKAGAATALEPSKDSKYNTVAAENFSTLPSAENDIQVTAGTGFTIGSVNNELNWTKDTTDATAELRMNFPPVSNAVAASVKLKFPNNPGHEPNVSIILGDGSYEYATAKISTAASHSTTISAGGNDYQIGYNGGTGAPNRTFEIVGNYGRLDLVTDPVKKTYNIYLNGEQVNLSLSSDSQPIAYGQEFRNDISQIIIRQDSTGDDGTYLFDDLWIGEVKAGPVYNGEYKMLFYQDFEQTPVAPLVKDTDASPADNATVNPVTFLGFSQRNEADILSVVQESSDNRALSFSKHMPVYNSSEPQSEVWTRFTKDQVNTGSYLFSAKFKTFENTIQDWGGHYGPYMDLVVGGPGDRKLATVRICDISETQAKIVCNFRNGEGTGDTSQTINVDGDFINSWNRIDIYVDAAARTYRVAVNDQFITPAGTAWKFHGASTAGLMLFRIMEENNRGESGITFFDEIFVGERTQNDTEIVNSDKILLDIEGNYSMYEIDLPMIGAAGSQITWEADATLSNCVNIKPNAARNAFIGEITTPVGEAVTGNLTATLKSGNVTDSKQFAVSVAPNNIYSLNSVSFANGKYVATKDTTIDKVFVENFSQTDTAKVIIALYDNQRLINAKVFTAEPASGSTAIDVNMTIPNEDKAFNVKSFMLNNTDSITPLVPSYPFTSAVSGAKVYVAGDSTASNDNNSTPKTGWAQVLGDYLDLEVDNHATDGRSSRSFINEGRLASILDQINPGDYLLIQFGHNDEKAGVGYTNHSETAEEYSYREYLKKYIRLTRAKGATPVIVTTIPRVNYLDDTIIEDNTIVYSAAAKEVAQSEGVAVIDLNTALYNAYRASDKATVQGYYAPNDTSHLNTSGANYVANLFKTLVVESGLNIPVK